MFYLIYSKLTENLLKITVCMFKIYRNFVEKITRHILKNDSFFRILMFCLPCSRAAIDYLFDYIGNALPAMIVPHAHKGQR